MEIHSIDFDLQTGKYFVQFVGSLELVEKIYKRRVPIYLPNCDASHELAGQWFLDNRDVQPHIITNSTVFDLSKYGLQIDGQYVWMPPTLFIKSNEWELVLEHNVFDHELTLYFRPLATRRKNSHVSSTRTAKL